METSILSEANPWWATKSVPEILKGLPRPGYRTILYSTRISEITILTGVRRSGKSTLMYQIIDSLLKNGISAEQILFVNLEDNRLAKDTLDDIYQSYRENINPDKKAYVFLDEVHRKEKWESWVRRHYDQKSECKFVVSGSCSCLLKKEYSTLLTGRNLTFEVFPLSFAEFLLFKGIEADRRKVTKGIILKTDEYRILNALKEYMTHGGFPDVFFKDEGFKTKVLSQYFDDTLYKDIIDRYSLNSKKAKDLALYFMANFTSVMSLRNLRAALGLSYESIKDYLSYFQEAFLFFTLDHFSYSMKEQKTRSSKVYCIDNGLRNAVSFKFSKDEGKLAENLVFLELRRNGADVYYWKNKGEVDFVVKCDSGKLEAINVSFTDDINDRELNGLDELSKEYKLASKIIITKGLEKKEAGIEFVPLWKWLLGKQ